METVPLFRIHPGSIPTLAQLQQYRNLVDCSEFSDLDHRLGSIGYGIKMVTQGTEHYTYHGRHYPLQTGEFMLVPYRVPGHVGIASRTPTRGVCFNLDPNLVAQVDSRAQLLDERDNNTSLNLAQVDGVLHLHQSGSAMGNFLRNFSQKFTQRTVPSSSYSNDFFFQLAELYVADYRMATRGISRIVAVKQHTRMELYRRLQIAAGVMEDSYLRPMTVADIAHSALLSEYQFFRLYKSVYGVSPYQFILEKRLSTGKRLIAGGQHSVSEAALAAGFADVFSFSKAFKKKYGVPPTRWQAF